MVNSILIKVIDEVRDAVVKESVLNEYLPNIDLIDVIYSFLLIDPRKAAKERLRQQSQEIYDNDNDNDKTSFKRPKMKHFRVDTRSVDFDRLVEKERNMIDKNELTHLETDVIGPLLNIAQYYPQPFKLLKDKNIVFVDAETVKHLKKKANEQQLDMHGHQIKSKDSIAGQKWKQIHQIKYVRLLPTVGLFSVCICFILVLAFI